MQQSNLVRGLRIAWTAGWGILCVLLIVLWVRSYWWHDELSLRYKTSISLQSFRGEQFIASSSQPWKIYKASRFGPDPRRPWDWTLRSRPLPKDPENRMGFFWASDDDGLAVVVPHWLLALLTAIMAAIFSTPWLRWSFSLRTLLIATTLVAVVLGLAAWAVGR
jgi:hypothetical protein